MNTLPLIARWIAGLLAVSAIVFAVAILVERHGPSEGPAATEQVSGEGTEAGEAAERQENAAGEAGHPEAGEAGERLLGINLESPWLVWGFVAISVAVAAAVLRLWPAAFAAAVVIAGLAGILDIREAMTKYGADNLIAILALLIAAAHAAAAVLAVLAIRRLRDDRRLA